MALSSFPTATENVRFFMDVYPWEVNFPPHDINSLFKELPKVSIMSGILSIQIHRSKDNPYGTTNINFFGKLPKEVFPGNWVLIRSYNGVQSPKDGVVRFFGQIFSMKPSYSVTQAGGLTQYTSINVREWSFILSTPIRYDSYAQLNLITDNYLRFLGEATTLAKTDFKELTADMSATILDPFQFAATALKWIGALSKKGLEDIQKGDTYADNFAKVKLEDFKLPDIALLMPKVPKNLLLDLGVPEADVNKPFAGDFVIQQFGVNTKDASDGFDSAIGVFDDKQSFYDTFEIATKRPLYSNILPVFVTGQSCWDIIQQSCDTFVNEIFTDLVFYQEGNKIQTRPLLVFRDKPFLMRHCNEAETEKIGAKGSNWSYYDNLPRIDIPAETIERVDFDVTISSSPNYIRTQYVPDGALTNPLLKVEADVKGTLRLPAEMLRYGGQTLYVQTPYINVNSGFLPDWYKDLALLNVYWHGMLYRMPSCQLIIRDTNICLTVGFNVRFSFGGHYYVGHLTNYSITYSRNSEGTHRTTTVLNLERLVMEDPAFEGKNLTYIPEGLLRDIFDSKVQAESIVSGINIFKDIEKKESETTRKDNNNKSYSAIMTSRGIA